jgi:predicted anti-sigma-YlaC factor YlaD
MKTWNSKGHLSELALELRAAGEAALPEFQAIDAHLRECPACRAREGEWRRLFHALASMQAVEPSRSFDARVMAQVRVPEPAHAAATNWLPAFSRRLRPVALAAAAVWTMAVVLGAAWLQSIVDVPASMLLARLFSDARELLMTAVLKIGAALHLSGLADAWSGITERVPGYGFALAVILMTVLSGLAIWTLYRVTEYQPPEVNAHA